MTASKVLSQMSWLFQRLASRPGPADTHLLRSTQPCGRAPRRFRLDPLGVDRRVIGQQVRSSRRRAVPKADVGKNRLGLSTPNNQEHVVGTLTWTCRSESRPHAA